MSPREDLLTRFLKYVKVDTQSVEGSDKTPSSPGQMVLAKIVAEDLKQAGVQDVEVTDECFIFGTIRENIPDGHAAKGKVPTLGFSAHLDVAPEAPGTGIKPRIIKDYKGGKITFDANPELVLDPDEEKLLNKCIGHTVITSDGTTLLGADDKAGIAAIVEMAHYFNEHPEEHHGRVRIAIMPDEEISTGSEKMDIRSFGVDAAYTVDSFGLGCIDVESFNGFKGKLSVKGVNAFPGYGKGVYLNAGMVISKFISMMPAGMWPENCAGRDPIWWVDELKGATGEAEATIYLRNFDIEGIEEQKKILNRIKDKLLKEHPAAKIELSFSESYRNYRQELNKDRRIIDYAVEAMKKAGIEPEFISVRGGNDACHFCFKGLLSTNVFAGFNLMHSLKEWTTLELIQKSTETIISIVRTWFERSSK